MDDVSSNHGFLTDEDRVARMYQNDFDTDVVARLLNELPEHLPRLIDDLREKVKKTYFVEGKTSGELVTLPSQFNHLIGNDLAERAVFNAIKVVEPKTSSIRLARCGSGNENEVYVHVRFDPPLT